MSIANEVGRTLVIAKNTEHMVMEIARKVGLPGEQVRIILKNGGGQPTCYYGELVSIEPWHESTDEGTKVPAPRGLRGRRLERW